jgi:hypothetical protein
MLYTYNQGGVTPSWFNLYLVSFGQQCECPHICTVCSSPYSTTVIFLQTQCKHPSMPMWVACVTAISYFNIAVGTTKEV